MVKFKNVSVLYVSALVIFSLSIAFAGRPYEQVKKPSALQKVYANDLFAAMTINNIFSYYNNNGDGSLNPFTGDGGFELVSANRGISIFEEGFLWGGKHMKDTTLKVGGSTYNHGLQAGKILTAGTTSSAPVAENVDLPKNRIYRVRPDIGPNVTFASVKEKLTNEEIALLSKYESLTEQDVYDQYVKDWNEWPATDGAPYEDVNGNHQYDPTVDIPGVPGADQTIWYVSNDLDPDRVYYLAGSTPIGIEFQRTIWAYRRSGALGNVVFQKNIMINKSGYDVDSMYVAQWADPDLGGGLGYTDDFTGCDTVLSLGYVYNGDAQDGFFGNKPPATGFDFFQGPLVSAGVSDSGKFAGKYIHGKKNLGMTSFNFFINSNSTYADPRLQDPRGTEEWYNLMRGLVGRTGAPYTNPTTGLTTPYVMSGDPVTGRGWLEGDIAPPGDRRMALCSGPFTLANGDTQEIVVAALTGQGSNRLSSVSVLKFYDQFAQLAYDNNFDLPSAPKAPVVQVGELENKIVLNWGDPTTAAATEGQTIANGKGYAFEGYNIYQTPTAGFSNAKLLATYDKVNGVLNILDAVYDDAVGTVVTKPVQFGNDYGITRTFTVDKDFINDKPLVNGQSYYFAVTAYNYNPTLNAVPATLESAPQVIKIVPQSAKPGVTYQYSPGDTILATHTGTSDGQVRAFVVDPSKLTGHNYTVTFDTTGGTMKWHLKDVTANKVLLANQTDQTGAVSYSVDGFEIGVVGAPNDAKDLQHVANPSGPINPPTYVGFSSFNNLGFPDPTNQGAPITDWGGGRWGINQGGGADGSYATFKTRVFRNDNYSRFVPYDFEMRFTAAGGKGYLAFTSGKVVDVPFELWNIGINTPNDPSDDHRMIPWINDADGNDLFNLDSADHPLSGGDNDPYTDWIYWMEPGIKTPGTAGYDATIGLGAGYDAVAGTLGEKEVMARMVLVNVNGGSITDPTWPANVNSLMPATGNVIRILSTKPNTVGDAFSFVAKAPTNSVAQAKEDIKKINVFPNPYFGFNSKEPNKYTKFVTFNHLPQKAEISILNLAGVRVRKYSKDDASQFFTWDLKNESGLPVSSGMYVVYIDLGSLGTKILKLAVIQEVQQLDKY